ncbi:MAG: 7-cyano-7-deazaguanine synthase QueC [Candidatus Binatia bacterium]|nr:7-cyano-7-deazaguanine synthase QueC [Candidatus Binatia bacterium]
MTKALVVLSGGQDSTTCLAMAMRDFGKENVYAVTFHYGQRHAIEVYAARAISELAGINNRHELIEVGDILRGTSPLIDPLKAVDDYQDAASLPGGLEKTFVPMRNTLFLTIAANRAVDIALQHKESVVIYTGLSQEDYGGYPDCRAEFVEAFQFALDTGLDDPSIPPIRIAAPLLHLTKEETVRASEAIEGARDLLAWSHTCYKGEVPPCGHCHACLLRAKGYAEAGVTDPLVDRLAADRGNNVMHHPV